MRELKVLFAIGLIFVMGFLGSARADGPLTDVTTVALGTKAHDIVLQGSFAYVATDLGLTILDISNPALPIIRGSVSLNTSGGNQGVDVKGDYAYVAGRYSGLHVVDISNPDAPQFVRSKAVGGQAWDVAVKDEIVYMASFGGELYLFNISNPTDPKLVKSIGLLAWKSAGSDPKNLARLNNLYPSGNAIATGVSVAGNNLFAVDWRYGRLYYYDITNAAQPVFKGTHYAPFLLKAEADPARDVVYMLGAYGRFSGIYSVPISLLGPDHSTRYDQCPSCGFLQANTITQGGLGVAAGGDYAFFAGGKVGKFHVVDVSDPVHMAYVGSDAIGNHYVKLAQSMGLASRGDYIYLAAGATGVQVRLFPGLSD